ncbi:hypothetical protein M9H77_04421 [Catharanthus roseus]|uniref:Uncharacterized protein n=1 Tax=Catharanthus roseus TaxID=4058 RepID=A0ACC0CEG8_CATRO|nr:hypothetical protein M9H77_04421 [Catharanthus roseus]
MSYLFLKRVQYATVRRRRNDADYRLGRSYHILCRRHIDQNVLEKLTEMVKDEEVATRFVLHFGVEITNRAESEHSVLKLWLSTCHGDLNTVFLNINSSSLEISKLKEKSNAKSNPILKNISNNITREIVDDAQNKCGHYLRKSHVLPCAYELLGRYKNFLLLQLEDVSIFWRTLEIGVDVPSAHVRDMDSEMRDLAYMLDQISRVQNRKSGNVVV